MSQKTEKLMLQFRRNVKGTLYFVSVILPVVDAVIGIVKGLKKGFEDIRESDQQKLDAYNDALREKIQRGEL